MAELNRKMAKNTEIQWTKHTFNPWWGCGKVSPACQHCYAEAWAKRLGKNVWGAEAPRRFLSDAYWKEPLKWNKEAKAAGERYLVFCTLHSIPFHFKQWGNWSPSNAMLRKKKHMTLGDELMIHQSKVASGRLFDGRTWDEFPDPMLYS